MRRILPVLMLLAMAWQNAAGVEHFPPPQFEVKYTIPTTQTPAPRSEGWAYADVALLVAVLAAGTWMALRFRRRRAIWALAVVSLIYFGFVRKGCVCAIGAIQNVTLGLAEPSYFVPATVIAFLLLPVLASLFFGRSFCGSVCPLGAIQDVVLIKPLAVPSWLDHSLRLLSWVYLALAVLFAATGSAFIICQYDPFVSFFRLGGGVTMLALGACLLVMGLFIGRPYCRYLCPLGAVFRCSASVSKWRVTITPGKCIGCRLCENACPFGAIQPPAAADAAPASRAATVTFALLVPVLMAGGGLLVSRLAGPLSQMHETVRLAGWMQFEKSESWTRTQANLEALKREKGEAEYLRQAAPYKRWTDAADAFRASARSPEQLNAQTQDILRRFAIGGWAAGGFLGLVLGLKLVSLTVRRRRDAYEANRGECFACGRCFEACPIEKQRRKGILPPAEKPKPAAAAAPPPTAQAIRERYGI